MSERMRGWYEKNIYRRPKTVVVDKALSGFTKAGWSKIAG